MKGINIKEFRETLEYGHELEFEYSGNTYVIQPIEEDIDIGSSLTYMTVLNVIIRTMEII